MTSTELSTTEASELLGVTAETVRQWCKNDILKGRQTGKRSIWRVSRRSVQDFLEEHPRSARPGMDLEKGLRETSIQSENLRRERNAAEEILAQLREERRALEGDLAAARDAGARLARMVESFAHDFGVVLASLAREAEKIGSTD